MADYFAGMNYGATPSTVTSGTSTTSKSVEVRITSGVGITKKEAMRCIEAIKAYLLGRAVDFDKH